MESRLIVGFFLHFLIPGSAGDLTTPYPSNTAVLVGTPGVTLFCASTDGPGFLAWSYLPVGGSGSVDIGSGTTVLPSQSQTYKVEASGSKQSNLTILSITPSTAGIYYCSQGTSQVSAQLIVFNSSPVCTMTPNAPTELLYNQAVQMSCRISYTANAAYVAVDMIWSKDGSTSVITNAPPNTTTSSSLTTAVTTITQTPGDSTPFPVYRCNTTFKVTGNPPPGSANNAPGYSKSTPLFSSPIEVIYLKPADANSITGPKDGDQVYLGTTVTCNVEGNPLVSYSWLDVMYGNITNTSSIQIWHNGEFRCTAWNKAASTSASISVTTYATTAAPTPATTAITTRSVTSRSTIPSGPGGLSDGGKIGIGVGIGVGVMLVLVGILFLILCRRYEWIKRTKTGDDKRSTAMDGDSDRTLGDNSNTRYYEPLNVLSAQTSNDGPTYEQLTTTTNVDAIEQSRQRN